MFLDGSRGELRSGMSDQDARLTVTTLNWGSRSMWTSKTKWPGQVESARSSATVLATTGDAGFNFDPEVIAVTEEMFLHRLDCLD